LKKGPKVSFTFQIPEKIRHLVDLGAKYKLIIVDLSEREQLKEYEMTSNVTLSQSGKL